MTRISLACCCFSVPNILGSELLYCIGEENLPAGHEVVTSFHFRGGRGDSLDPGNYSLRPRPPCFISASSNFSITSWKRTHHTLSRARGGFLRLDFLDI
jgi:hypothetical protein